MNVRMPPRWPLRRILLAIVVLGAACQKASEAPAADRAGEAPAAEMSITPVSAMLGTWTVVAHQIPGISALSDVEAAAWHGRTLRLTATHARSVDDQCDSPAYTARTVATDSLLDQEFRIDRGSLTLLQSAEHLTLLQVTCGDAPWTTLGGLIIGVTPGHALAPWDGVFFELEQDPDFRALGQEPFWHLQIRNGQEIRFTLIGNPDVVMPVPAPTTDPASGTLVYHAVTQANDLQVLIVPKPCTDAMSGRRFATTVTVTLDHETYHGCGGEGSARRPRAD